jgi:hypothetical protein
MFNSNWRRATLLLALIVSFGISTRAAEVTLTWGASSDATRGAVSGYKIYYSAQSFASLPANVSSNPAFTIVPLGNQTEATVGNLAGGQTYFFAVTTVATNGVESDPSNILPYVAVAVNLTSPTNGAIVLSNQQVPIAATVAGSTSVSKIELYEGPALLGSLASAPYVTSNNFAPGTYALTARAYIGTRILTSAPVSITVNLAPNVLPAIALTAPTNNASFLVNQPIPLSASATDSDGTIAKVEFFNGSTLIDTKTAAPYSSTLLGLQPGSYSLSARATDDRGGTTTSAPIAITVKLNQTPTVALTSPANNSAFLTNQVVTFSATASDSDGTVTKVEFFDGASLLGTITASPYTMALSTLGVGSHSITAKATDDKAGSATTAASIITIRTNQPPTVALTSPANSSTFGTNDVITLSASANDPDGAISRVQFFDGSKLLATAAATPYSVVSSFAVGSHTLTAQATDNQGAVVASAPVAISVRKNFKSGTSAAGAPPSIQLVNLTAGAMLSQPVALQALASDTDGTVTSVEFFAADTSMGVSTNAPFSISVPMTPGLYSFYAVATDNDGLVTASVPIIARVKPKAPVALVINTSVP